MGIVFVSLNFAFPLFVALMETYFSFVERNIENNF